MSEEDPMIGRKLAGTIEIVRKIGAGGMGNVYEGYQRHLDRKVAVKVLTAEHAQNPSAAKYFLREARQSSQLRHPNVIQIIDYGQEDDSTLFMAMEFIPGLPLSKIMRKEWPFTTQRTIDIMDQVLAGLKEAHSKELIHRDLKPDNLMVEEIDGKDFVKVLDFGIAHSKAQTEAAGPLTMQGAVVGTPQYMSPEQAVGGEVDGRSDLFSLGIILYEMLAKKSPFRRKNLPEILMAVLKYHPDPPSSVRPEAPIDARLEAICLRAIKKEPDLRYQSAQDFRDALQEVLSFPAPQQQQAAPKQFVLKKASAAEQTIAHDHTMASVENLPEVNVDPLTDFGSSLGGIDRKEGDVSWNDQRPSTGGGGLGLDLEALKGDLVGERAWVTAVVLHQRSHKRLEAEDLAHLHETIESILATVLEQWGGRFHSRQGGFTTLLFDARAGLADDGFRAAQAALDLRARIQRTISEDTGFTYSLASGEIFSPGGKIEHAAGAPLDQASDGARSTADGTVSVVGESLSAKLEAMFRLGKDEGGARAILGLRDVGKAAPLEETRRTELVGRDTEVALTLEMLGEIGRGRGSSVVFMGEPGMGKTAMLREAARIAGDRGQKVLAAHMTLSGPEGLREARLQWLASAVSQHGRTMKDLGSALREMGLGPEYARVLEGMHENRLSRVFGFVGTERTIDTEADAGRAADLSLRKLISVIAQEHPVLLVLDDVTEFTHDLWDFLDIWTQAFTAQPVAVAIGVQIHPGRELPSVPDGVRIITLPRLDEASARALLKVELPGDFPPALIGRLARITAGVPLQIDQIARYAKQKGVSTAEEAESWLAQAGGLGEIFRLRLLDLPRNAQNLLALMSVLGNAADPEVLLELCATEWDPEELIGSLVEAGYLDVDGTNDEQLLYFNPPSFGHAVYNQLSRKMKGKIHERVARLYEERVRNAALPDRTDLIALARHREKSGDARGAFNVLKRVIEDALCSFEFDIARVHIRHAIDLLRRHSGDSANAIASMRLKLVRVLDATGNRDEALAEVRSLDAQKDLDPRVAVEVRLELARIWLQEEDADLVEKLAQSALTDVRRLSMSHPDNLEITCLLVRALQLYATVLEKRGAYAAAARAVIEAAEILDRAGIGPTNNPWGPALVWETLNQLGRIRIRTQDLEAARRMFELALDAAQAASDLRGEMSARANMAALLIHEDRLDAAYQMQTSAVKLAQQLSDLRALAKLEYNRAQILERQRRMELAEQAYNRALELAEEIDWNEGIALAAASVRHFASRERH